MQGQYDRVHVGASCPPDRLRALLALLRPEGGKIITPVCNDLRLISVNAEGEVRQERISQVRYSDLEVMALFLSLTCTLGSLYRLLILAFAAAINCS